MKAKSHKLKVESRNVKIKIENKNEIGVCLNFSKPKIGWSSVALLLVNIGEVKIGR